MSQPSPMVKSFIVTKGKTLFPCPVFQIEKLRHLKEAVKVLSTCTQSRAVERPAHVVSWVHWMLMKKQQRHCTQTFTRNIVIELSHCPSPDQRRSEYVLCDYAACLGDSLRNDFTLSRACTFCISTLEIQLSSDTVCAHNVLVCTRIT